jgi:hypothetical protein
MNGTSVSGDPTKIFRERTWPSKALMTSFHNHLVTQEPSGCSAIINKLVYANNRLFNKIEAVY